MGNTTKIILGLGAAVGIYFLLKKRKNVRTPINKPTTNTTTDVKTLESILCWKGYHWDVDLERCVRDGATTIREIFEPLTPEGTPFTPTVPDYVYQEPQRTTINDYMYVSTNENPWTQKIESEQYINRPVYER